MPLRSYKATSPGLRQMTRSTFEEITTDQPYKPLLEPQTRGSGRNNQGRLTVRHRGGGEKQQQRDLSEVGSQLQRKVGIGYRLDCTRVWISKTQPLRVSSGAPDSSSGGILPARRARRPPDSRRDGGATGGPIRFCWACLR